MKSPMHGTGIGYAGIDGVWWLPAERHFVWPRAMRDHLARVGDALFQFVDAVWRVLESGSDPELAAQLRHRVPESLTSHFDLAPVLSFRPDFQLVPTGEPALPFRPVLTEIEIAPSAQGFAHAMQVGYGLSTDIADSFAAFLDGRTFYIVGTAQWSEFLFEQLAFCRALAERGATAFVLYDRPLATLAAEIARGERWQPPIFGIPTRPPGWNVDLQARFQTHGFERFWLDQWPEQVDDGVVYRFGYLENFDAAHLARMDEWRANGATFINPLAYPLDSKVLLTALQRPTLRSHLSPTTLDLLDGAIPETHLLTPAILPILQQERWLADQICRVRRWQRGLGRAQRGAWSRLRRRSVAGSPTVRLRPSLAGGGAAPHPVGADGGGLSPAGRLHGHPLWQQPPARLLLTHTWRICHPLWRAYHCFGRYPGL
jgi:hypothetical protein